jgi:hypothetical protein
MRCGRGAGFLFLLQSRSLLLLPNRLTAQLLRPRRQRLLPLARPPRRLIGNPITIISRTPEDRHICREPRLTSARDRKLLMEGARLTRLTFPPSRMRRPSLRHPAPRSRHLVPRLGRFRRRSRDVLPSALQPIRTATQVLGPCGRPLRQVLRAMSRELTMAQLSWCSRL